MQINQRVAMGNDIIKQGVSDTRRRTAVGVAGKVAIQVAPIRQIAGAAAKTLHIHDGYTNECAGQFSRFDVVKNTTYHLNAVEFIAMIIVGGMGTVLGSIFGAVFITLVPEGLRWVSYAISRFYPVVADKFSDDWNIAFFGLLIMLFLIFEPGGLAAIWERVKTSFKTWPFTY